MSRDNRPLTWFQAAGDDRFFYPARAVIEGGTIRVTSQSVERPVAVRFAWHQRAEPNLMNREELPAVPFRTDNWPVDTTDPEP